MPAPDLERLPLLGGRLCLDFANSVDPRYGPDRIEYVPDYAALVEWAVRTGALPAEGREPLLAAAAADPARADGVHRRAHALREDLYALLRPARAVDDRLLQSFNRELRRACRHAIVETHGSGFRAGWQGADELDAMLWPVVRSAAELMLDDRALARVHECDGHNCGWLFLDTSKAGRRRWCSMESCGTRAKAQRYRRRLAEA
jgi:predicted RNA-binding Zn ribbon-like protein